MARLREDEVSILAPLARGALHLDDEGFDKGAYVSILAPLARGALRRRRGELGAGLEVSILAPLARGALRHGHHHGPGNVCRFNPRPPRKGGATGTGIATRPHSPRFNPRPPRKGGATPQRNGVLACRIPVSILAPLARGALHVLRGTVMQYGSVSILAPLARGALQTLPSRPGPCRWFQSSPPSQGGRYAGMMTPWRPSSSFNPRPPRKGGATPQILCASWGRRVSILAPLARGALPTSLKGKVNVMVCFNPRPPRKGGATKGFSFGDRLEPVSILAPLARGALHKSTSLSVGSRPFQSSPPSQGGRYVRRWASRLP